MADDSVKHEKMEYGWIANMVANLNRVVNLIEDSSTWLVLSLTLKMLEPHAKVRNDLYEDLLKKAYKKDNDGNIVMVKKPLVDENGVVIKRTNTNSSGKDVEEIVMVDDPVIEYPEKFKVKIKELDSKTVEIAWKDTILYKDIAQFPIGYKIVQHELLDRVLRR